MEGASGGNSETSFKLSGGPTLPIQDVVLVSDLPFCRADSKIRSFCNASQSTPGSHQENMKLLKYYLICLNPLNKN